MGKCAARNQVGITPENSINGKTLPYLMASID